MNDWKRNLLVVWLAQFFSIMGFSFALPFAPFYIQELGVTDSDEIKMMTALFASAAPLTMAVFSPIWGVLADRYGRKLMLLRANCAGAVVLTLMGTVPSVWPLIALRLLQGVFTGTVTASQTLVSANTPSHRSGLALGALNGAIYSGMLAGSFFGGWFADMFGYRHAFLVSGAFLFASAFLVYFGASERFVKPAVSGAADFGLRAGWVRLAPVLPIIILFAGTAFARQFDAAMLPLLVQEIHGGLKGAATWTGSLNAVCGVSGILAALLGGVLADRINPTKLGKYSAALAAMMMFPQGLAISFATLFPARFMMNFFIGGLDPVLLVWVSKATPEKSRGLVFGWAATAKSLGWMLAPLASGVTATIFGVRSVYFIGAALMLLLIPLIGLATGGVKIPARDSDTSESG